MLNLHELAYRYPNKEILFDQLNLSIHRRDKIALIGANGAGKSTLLRLMASELTPSSGSVSWDTLPYYIPQLTDQFSDWSVARVLQAEDKLRALHQILSGCVTEEDLNILDNDWLIEDRCLAALAHWQLNDIDLSQQLATLSGGQKTRVFLAGIFTAQSEIVLLDEPSNHLDTAARAILYNYIRSTKDTLVVVSHDRTLLNLLDTVMELESGGITVFGGNYDFYTAQKAIAQKALEQDLQSREGALRKAKETEKAAMERQHKLDTRGKGKQEKAGLPRIVMNTLRNNAERSTARLKGVHTEKVNALSQELSQLRSEMSHTASMKLDLDNSCLYSGKTLVKAQSINFSYGKQSLWDIALNFNIVSGERLAIKGANGSGKSTLLKMILGELLPLDGALERAPMKTIYIDQDYSLIDLKLSVYDQAQSFNTGALQEHEIKIRLNRYLFGKDSWDKPCSALSGGERMRLALCCITIGQHAPDMIVLDEPTNNLDIKNTEILTAGINSYQGTLVVVSHDEHFLKETGIQRLIVLA